jgi:hypothetical protein
MATVENGVRILWKYIDKHSRDIHFSWERWDKRTSYGFWEFRLPPEQE